MHIIKIRNKCREESYCFTIYCCTYHNSLLSNPNSHISFKHACPNVSSKVNHSNILYLPRSYTHIYLIHLAEEEHTVLLHSALDILLLLLLFPPLLHSPSSHDVSTLLLQQSLSLNVESPILHCHYPSFL